MDAVLVIEPIFETDFMDIPRGLSPSNVEQANRDYIANFYNVARRHPYLGYVSSAEFERRSGALSQIA